MDEVLEDEMLQALVRTPTIFPGARATPHSISGQVEGRFR